MDVLKEVLTLIKELAWPVTILSIALLFRTPILAALHAIIPERGMRQRNLRVKMGAFEIESQLAERAQELFRDVAREPDMEKRLQMIKAPLFLEAAIRAVKHKDIEALAKLHESRLTNAFHINWYKPELDGVDVDVCRRLMELGLISMASMYDGDEIGLITPVGIALLQRLSPSKSEPNHPLNTDAQQASLPRAG